MESARQNKKRASHGTGSVRKAKKQTHPLSGSGRQNLAAFSLRFRPVLLGCFIDLTDFLGRLSPDHLLVLASTRFELCFGDFLEWKNDLSSTNLILSVYSAFIFVSLISLTSWLDSHFISYRVLQDFTFCCRFFQELFILFLTAF